MPQTVWKGALSFGLVNVPVSLVGTTRSASVTFRQLHGEDKAPIKLERRCTGCNEIVPFKSLVKGAEVGKDQFVVLTKEELEHAEPESSRTLRIMEFVDAKDVDRIYHERSYAVAPQPGGERAYALLHDALARRGEVAIGRLTLRNREDVVALRAGESLLFADVLHYADEVRDLGEIQRQVVKEPEITPEEAELADVLIERLHRGWDPQKYEDEYDKRVRALVEAKARGETFEAPKPAERAATTDLLSALRETLRMQEAKREDEAEAT